MSLIAFCYWNFIFYTFIIFITQFVRMPNIEKKLGTLLFTNETTYLNSYKPPEMRPMVKTTYRAKRRKPRPDYDAPKNLHTLTPYKNPNVPFDLFHRPDPIIRRDPRKMQEPYEEIQDEDRAIVQKSRPKVVGKGPACDLDALEEPDRQIIIDDMYLTTTSKAQREAVAGTNLEYVRAPLPNAYSKCRPVFIEPLTEPFVSPEWRIDTVTWDGAQSRVSIDPTNKFWLMREKSFCSVCEDTAMKTAMNKYKTRN